MKIKIWEIALFAALIVSVLVGTVSARQTELSENLIRLHVVANSDSEEDQSLKLAVRDGVLKKLGGILKGCTDKAAAEVLISENMDALIDAAEDVISEKGESFTVSSSIAEEVFPTVEYDTFTLPAGKYTSLRVVIGAGEGKNWWCVVFPPLCLTAAEDTLSFEELGISDETFRIISGESDEYVVKFKVLEWLSQVKLWLG